MNASPGAAPDILARMTPAIRSAWAVGLPEISGTIEDAATELLCLRAENARLRATILHVYGAATEEIPSIHASSAEQADAMALTYIAHVIEGAGLDRDTTRRMS